MTTIVLPPDLEADLNQQATCEGKSLEVLAIEGLRQFVSSKHTASAAPKNLKEYLGDMIGRLEGNGEALSENCGERFTEYLLEKQKAGKI